MTKRPMTKLDTSKYNLRRSLDFERSRLTDAEWGELREWTAKQTGVIQMEWIDAQEQRPDDDSNVIVCFNGIVCVGSYWRGWDEWELFGTLPRRVTMVDYWMPLPEPPQRAEQRQGGGEEG